MVGNPEQRPIDAQPPFNQEDYEQLLDDFSHLAPPAEGELLEGRVLAVTDLELIVDVGYKSEGVVPIEQVRQRDGAIPLKPGDPIDVVIDRHGPQREDFILLSHERALRLRAWQNLERAFRENLMVAGRVMGRVKGGLSVDVGVKAFMPSSLVDPRPIHNIDVFIGQDIPVKILKLNRRRGNVVVSRRAAVEEETTARRSATLGMLHEGAIVTGAVKNLTDYGAFVELGGIDGLLHVSDLSYGRVNHPSEVLSVGDQITARVLKVDPNRERVSLGLKQMLPDPWDTVAERYQPRSRAIGRVVSTTDYGAFVELEPGVEGLIHITEMTWSRRLKHPSKVVKVGDSVEVVVMGVSRAERRISLGLKQLEADPWTTLDRRYSVGSVVEGRVRKLTEFGAFVEIEEGVDGLVHVSDLSWTKRVKHPSEVLKKGQTVSAVILNLDVPARRLSLGVKQLTPDAWESYFQAHEVGDTVKGKVVRAASFGYFVELAEGVEGLCHRSELPPAERGGGPPPIALGRVADFKIIKMSEAEKKIGLSMRAAAEDEERGRLEDYHRQAAAATVAIEEIMNLKTQGGPGS